MDGVKGPCGELRATADGSGIGLYGHDLRHRFWLVTPTGAGASIEHGLLEHRANGLPVVDDRTLVWVGLNPSRADDGTGRRPSLQNVLHWARRHGADRVLEVGLFAYRDTCPRAVRDRLRTPGGEADVVGPGNDAVLAHLARHAEHVLLGWGTASWARERGRRAAALFDDPWCIGTGRDGDPLHPGRQPRRLPFVRYEVPGISRVVSAGA